MHAWSFLEHCDLGKNSEASVEVWGEGGGDGAEEREAETCFEDVQES